MTQTGKDEEILNKLNSIVDSLNGIDSKAYPVSTQDLDAVKQAISEVQVTLHDMQNDLDTVHDSYHDLDKRTEALAMKIDTLENDIKKFEQADNANEEKTATFVKFVVTSLVTSIIGYIFAQSQSW